MEQHQTPQGGENPYQQANPYGTDDPAIQAQIEQARTEASEERRRNRERLERYVEAGLSADDAEALVEFEQAARDQRARSDTAETPGRLTDDQLIHFHITEALREDRPIDDATARAIASQLHGGQASPLYALASSGAVVDDLTAELDAWRADNATGVEVEPWLDALDEYLASREDSGRVEGWAALWPAQPPTPEAPAEDDEAVATALLERLNAAGVTTLGQVATVVSSLVEQPEDSERDDFSWVDAAEWRPAEIALHDHEEHRYPAAELDELFAEVPNEQVGSVDELGWYGLVKHQGQPGGLILIQDNQGFRRVRETLTDDALQAQWAAIQAEYEDFHGQRDAYELATEQAAGSWSGLNPRIWVGSLADYNAGRLRGVWLDATLDPDELHQAIRFMLRNGHTPDAEEWGIFDHDEFGGFEVSEYTDLKTVSRVAQGVAEHGPAYAAWVELVGADSGELLTGDSFRDHYEGEFESTEDYVEYVLQETDFYRQLDEALAGIPEDLRRYVKVDVEGIAEEWAQGLHVVEASGRRVWVFDGRA